MEKRNELLSMKVAALLALTDIKMLYRRSTLGPLWMTMTLGAQILVIGLLFSTLFTVDTFSYLLYFGIGLIFWMFLTNVVNEGSLSLVTSGGLIRQVALPISTHALRVIIKNLFLLAHNCLLLVPLFLLSLNTLNSWTLLALPALVLVVANLVWITLSAGILAARYRDLPPIISGLVVIAFYATPIIWRPEQFEGSFIFSIIPFNPFYHLLEVFRQPLLGMPVPWQSVVALSLSAIVGFSLVKLLRIRMEKNVPFWV
jgi:ABC-type polysaccharide/polyol phosphate export permease